MVTSPSAWVFAQLVTVRATGTFLSDPSAVPELVVASLARRLGIAAMGVLAGYAKLAVAGSTPRRSGAATATPTSRPSPAGSHCCDG